MSTGPIVVHTSAKGTEMQPTSLSSELADLASAVFSTTGRATDPPRIGFPEDMGGMPCVLDRSCHPVPLFHVFAVIEENTDFVAACEELSDLSPAAIQDAMDFIYTRLQAGLQVEPLIEVFGHGTRMFQAVAEAVRIRNAAFRTAKMAPMLHTDTGQSLEPGPFPGCDSGKSHHDAEPGAGPSPGYSGSSHHDS